MENILKKIKECINENYVAIATLSVNEIEPSKKIDTMSLLIGLSELFETGIEDSQEIFQDFNAILNFMDLNKFSAREKFMTVMYLIQKNISKGFIDGQSLMLCLDNIYDIGISDSDIEKIEKVIDNGRIISIMDKIKFSLNNIGNNDDPYNLSSDEKRVEFVICSHIEELMVDSNSLREYHLIINEHYLDKKEEYTLDDINVVIDALSNMEISVSDCNAIKYIMQKDLEKRVNKSKSSVNIQGKTTYIESKETISNKEYKILLQQLKHYIDIELKTVTHLLSMEEIIGCIEIMIKLGLSTDEIKSYLKIMDKNQEISPITWYLNNLEKLNFYCSDNQYSNHLENIESYFKEIFICSDEDYVLWKSSIEEELNELKQMLPKTFKYELEVATKRTK